MKPEWLVALYAQPSEPPRRRTLLAHRSKVADRRPWDHEWDLVGCLDASIEDIEIVRPLAELGENEVAPREIEPQPRERELLAQRDIDLLSKILDLSVETDRPPRTHVPAIVLEAHIRPRDGMVVHDEPRLDEVLGIDTDRDGTREPLRLGRKAKTDHDQSDEVSQDATNLSYCLCTACLKGL